MDVSGDVLVVGDGQTAYYHGQKVKDGEVVTDTDGKRWRVKLILTNDLYAVGMPPASEKYEDASYDFWGGEELERD